MRAYRFSYKKMYEWMSHKTCHEVTTVEFCDWMEVDVEKEQKRKEQAVLLHDGLKQGASVLPALSGWRGEFVFMGWAHEKTSL